MHRRLTLNDREKALSIDRVSAWVLNVPFRYPLQDTDDVIPAVLVEIKTIDGVSGHAMARYPMPHAIRDVINREMADAMRGADALNIEAIRYSMYRSMASKYFTGVYACAASLIDIALWDIKGKLAGMPVWQLLGGARSSVPTYVTFGLARYSTDQLVEIAKTLVEQGHIGLKMIVGAPETSADKFGIGTAQDIERDAARVQAVREAFRPDIDLMIDANKNLNYPQALSLAHMVEPYNLTWFEDPVLQSDPRMLARLRQSTSVPIASGSTGTGDLFHLREFLLLDAVDYLQPNVRDIGGFTGGLKAAALAQAFNVPLQMGGNWPHMNMHLQAAVPNGGRVEFHWMGWQVVKMLFDGAPDPEHGYVTLSDQPGLGFVPKPGIVEEYAIS